MGRDSEILSALKVLAGFDEDLAHETTRAMNRFRSLLTQIHPALERAVIGRRLSTGLVLDLLEKFGSPTGLKTAGRGKVLWFALSHFRRGPEALVDRIFASLAEQTVIVPPDRGSRSRAPESCWTGQGAQGAAGDGGAAGRGHVGGLSSCGGLDEHAGDRL